MTKTFDKSEDDLKSLQSGVGQVSHFLCIKCHGNYYCKAYPITLMLSLPNVLQMLGQVYSDISVVYSYLHQGVMSGHTLMCYQNAGMSVVQ